MKNVLVPVRDFLERAQVLQRIEPEQRAVSIGYQPDKNNAFLSAVCRPHEFADHDCIVLALVGPKGGTRGLGALSIEQAKDLHAQLTEAIRRIAR